MRSRGFFRFEWLLFALAIGAGGALRIAGLDARPFWCDEAESAINALTIVQHGYPADRYLGLPIYENTLVRPWAGNPEYEFRDISYSDSGVAIYHSWLPLYAIAASLAVHGMEPDRPNPTLKSRYAAEEARRLTRAGRLPSVLFGLLFLMIAFAAGRSFYGKNAGWIALLTAAGHSWHVYLSRQARYYSATMTLSMACCLSVWLIATKGRWRDYGLGACLFILLFHTHVISFITACGMFALTALVMLYLRRLDLRKVAIFGAVVAAGTVPWALITGFLRGESQIPKGWSMLELPADFFRFPLAGFGHLVIGGAFVLFVLAVRRMGSRFNLRSRFTAPFLQCLPAALFLAAWSALGYLCFVAFMPAGSFFLSRLKLSYWGAMLLFGSVICASIVRTVLPRFTPGSVAAGMLIMGLLAGSSFRPIPRYGDWSGTEQLIGKLESLRLAPETKLYATPNDHLILTFYTGLPVQSIAPVRKAFLDQYPGDIVIVEASGLRWESQPLSPAELRKAAARSGGSLSEAEAERLSVDLLTRDYLRAVGRNVGCDAVPASIEAKTPSFAMAGLELYRKQAAEAFAVPPGAELMMRGFSAASWPDWMDVFFYRFANPEARRGPNRNYMNRLRGSTAFVLIPEGHIIYVSPEASRRDPSAGVNFQFVSPGRGGERSARLLN